MEVIRFINGQPVSSVPAMKIANEGVLRIMREAQMRAARENGKRPPGEAKLTRP